MAAQAAREEVQAGTLLDRLRTLNWETLAVLAQAKRARDGDLRLRALARLERQIELEGSMLGQLQQQGIATGVQVNVGDTQPDEERRVHQMGMDIAARLINSLPPNLKEQVARFLYSSHRSIRAAKLAEAEAKMRALMPPPPQNFTRESPPDN